MAAIERSNGAHLSLVCDDDHETAPNCIKLYRRIKNILNESLRERLSSISFADDKVYLALQAADLVASLFRLEGGNRFLGKQHDYSELLNYMAQDRGSMRTQWGYVFVGECAMAKIEIAWKSPKFDL